MEHKTKASKGTIVISSLRDSKLEKENKSMHKKIEDLVNKNVALRHKVNRLTQKLKRVSHVLSNEEKFENVIKKQSDPEQEE